MEKNKNWGDLFINFTIALYFLLFLLFSRSYNLAPTLLIISAIVFVFLKRKQIDFFTEKEHKILVLSYLVYFVIILLTVILHQDKLKDLDKPSRIILYLPVLLLLIHYKLRFKTLLYSIPMSAILAGCVACYQCFYLGDWGAFKHVQLIQGGDISMSLGIFSICMMLYSLSKGHKLLALFCFLGSLMGIFGSILSTARGGWIVLPIIIPFILIIYRKFIPKYFIPLMLGVFIISGYLFNLTDGGRLRDRIMTTQDQITRYFYKNDSDTSLGYRFDMWKGAWIAIKEKPILGWGNEGLKSKKEKLAENGIISKHSAEFYHNHNQFIDETAKRGIIGLIGLLTIFLIPLSYFGSRLIRQTNLEIRCLALCGTVHIISTMCYNLSQGFFAHNSGNTFYFLSVIIFYAAIKVQEKKHS
ncbi:O-antigen ligase family protein [Avibacterium paragallinarum]|uniref:O-antigen ligase family protein n=2 Tax=Avibacterium paragallinarum TaxID=728 RepID=A0AAE5WG23_AVIPA|nr:O-antigen ligase [Avibacterium paragallinarum]MEE3609263.1 O-antigen ligase [Avibacterium paragallinarum]MEE3668463.1 O-antigen ligase [Avibacterium paragallinarum]MEE3680921.1 O-antigen ligase [Avibacterium paragallinarum]MEE4386491.1 O-antigen ligase [Avibacterium paragallinarum]PXZ38468.1 RfaL protein [Avibacterium paragallinarum]